MSYRRVIPRDLFNEANLLKCYGQIYINLETANLPGVELTHLDEGGSEPFDVVQDENGGLSLANVVLMVNGAPEVLHRPLNSREPWPLYLTTLDGDEIAVFDSDGSFSAEFMDYLRSELPAS